MSSLLKVNIQKTLLPCQQSLIGLSRTHNTVTPFGLNSRFRIRCLRSFSTVNTSPSTVSNTSDENLTPDQLLKHQITKSMQNFSFELTPSTAMKLFVCPEGPPKPGSLKSGVLEQLKGLSLENKEITNSSLGHYNPIYITKLPGHPLQDTVDAVNIVRDFTDGHLPIIPHIPVRGLKGVEELDKFLEMLSKDGPLEHVLIIGGSVDDPLPAENTMVESMDALTSGVLEKHKIKTIGMAAHPQGADNLDPVVLGNAFEKKLVWAQNAMKEKKFEEVYWCTQLAYSTETIINWEKDLRIDETKTANNLRINLGLPGPATTTQLVKYAQMSGISNSVNYFKNNPVAAWNLLTKRSVLDDIVGGVAQNQVVDRKFHSDSFILINLGGIDLFSVLV